MSSSITFILPSLFESRCLHYLDETNLFSMEQLKQLLAKSDRKPIGSLQQWFSNHFSIPENYTNSANLMAEAHGLASSQDAEKLHWLRADPVMLSASHNGILCRGNRVLSLTKKERDSLESLINNYFKEQSIELSFASSNQGYIKYIHNAGCGFTPLLQVMGQDISHYLPSGKNEAFWHGLLTELQMLLHDCEVNQQRINNGLPTVSGFWLWAETDSSKTPQQEKETMTTVYSDDAALSGALDQPTRLAQLADTFDATAFTNDKVIIHVSEFEDAYSQNDSEGWQMLYQYWVVNWLLVSLEAVKNKQISQINLLTGDGYSYHYTNLSSWCFWRNHSFINNDNTQWSGEL